MALNSLQLREVFHLAFLRALVRTVSPDTIALKGGTNLRFFFGSFRYSEDMDLDASDIAVEALSSKVMSVLESSSFGATLWTYGISQLRLPDMTRAKQTETVQRFKVGLITPSGADLATKVEFSRRGIDEGILSEAIDATVLASYKMPSVIVPHYGSYTAAMQKSRALLLRSLPQARDVFDLYLLRSQPQVLEAELWREFEPHDVERIRETIYSVDYQQYRDTVVSFLAPDDRPQYSTPDVWDEIRLRAVEVLEAPEH